MDQNYQPYQPYEPEQFQIPVVKNAAYYRSRAKAALKGKLPLASVASFVWAILQSTAMMVGIIPFYIVMILQVIANEGNIEDPTFMLPMMLVCYAVMLLAVLFVSAPLTVGFYRIHLDVIDGKPIQFSKMFSGFKTGFGKSIKVSILYGLKLILTLLPFILFVVVGAVLSALVASEAMQALILAVMSITGYIITFVLIFVFVYRYSMVFYILAEYPEMRAIDVMRNSASLMKGRKWRLFCLQFSFIGWVFLLLLCGIVTCGFGIMVGSYVLSAYEITSTAAFYDDITNRAAARETEFPSLDPDDYVI